MRLEILGCSGGAAPGRRPSSYRVGHRIAIDAGALSTALSDEAIAQLEAVLLTHSHLDHVAEIPFVADRRASLGLGGLEIYGPAATLEALERDLFSGRLWPRLERLAEAKGVALRLREVAPNRAFRVADLRVTPLALDHPVDCVGYLLDDGSTRVFVGGDTGALEPIVEPLAALPDLSALIVECSFPSRLEPLARLTGHLTPSDLRRAWPLHPDARVLVTHLKPAHRAEIVGEILEAGLPGALVLEDCQTLDLS